MRAILESETYQRSSEALPGNAADTRFYSRYYPRRLMAEVLLDACSQVTGVPTEFRTDLRNQNRGLGDKYPAGLRALQLPDTHVFSYFLKTFGRRTGRKPANANALANPPWPRRCISPTATTLNQKLAAMDNVVSRNLESKMPVRQAHRRGMSRRPFPPA